MTGGGFGNAVVGTLLMVGIALVLATPFGILSAIYINEYDPYSRLSNAVRFVAKLLTGIPSIICGVFAYAVIVLTTGGFSAWAGGFALAILILPTILLTAEQALAWRAQGLSGSFLRLGRDQFPDDLARRAAGRLARNYDRHHACGGARRGRDGASDLHCALQPVLDPIAARTDGLVVRPYLQLLNTPL